MTALEMIKQIDVLTHSSIRIRADKIIYIDPFQIDGNPKDADVLFITHDHFDHFSPEDIKKVFKNDTTFVIPEAMREVCGPLLAKENELICVKPGQKMNAAGIEIETIAAYNMNKEFHPKENGWVGYILNLNGIRCYVAGDTDITEENKKVNCDIAMIPIGGTYTIDAEEAAEFINGIKPEIAIPIHYGNIVGKLEDADVFKSLVDSSIQVITKL
ncbi:MAG: MBL fold metallo-hydrolase [Eubacteriales bacterium]|nr:MBL fold metallo-hydrolase [Eubacteriales bacterium]